MKTILLLAAALCAMLIGCQSAIDLKKAPDIIYGQDLCVECGMMISEPGFAAAYVTKDGTIRRFDDIGGMVTYHAKTAENVAVFWVHDFDTEDWIWATKAQFVVSGELTTPMAHGVIAFRNRENANAKSAELNGRVMLFADLLALDANDGRPVHTHVTDDSVDDHQMVMETDHSGHRN